MSIQQQTSKIQGSLFEHGEHSRATRAASCNKKRSPVLTRIIEEARKAGQAGMIRHEFGERLGKPVHAICGPVLVLLKDGELVETPETRRTPYGAWAVVIIHRDYSKTNSLETSSEGCQSKRYGLKPIPFDRDGTRERVFKSLREKRLEVIEGFLTSDDLIAIEKRTAEIVDQLERRHRSERRAD
jgi:hypothetical protein